ncbi:MAG TPA: YMGG-like glycine zipper-containing protein [Sphingomonadales bacterium]|nr:YMGG-like glycine zipper-containing protein [Sphingomonadales bacterium]
MKNNKWIIPAAVAVVIGGGVVANEMGMFGSATTGGQVSGDKLRQDAAACEMWAYEQAGIPVSADDPTRKEYSVVKSTAIGTAAGAGVGAVGGEVIGDKAGKGAIIGAVVGGAAGYLKSRSDKGEYEASAAEQAAQVEAVEKAVTTCMTSKGY